MKEFPLMNNLFKLFTYIICLFLLSSCSSIFYSKNRAAKNNTITLISEVNNFNVLYQDKRKEMKLELRESTTKNQYFIYTPSPSRKSKIILTKINFDPIEISLKRSIRPRAIIFDLVMAVPSFGISIITNPFRSSSYKISNNSKLHKIEFKYSLIFMKNEYLKIEKSKNTRDFDDYILSYQYSPYVKHCINKRDSLEVYRLINDHNENGLKDFLTKRPKSKFALLADSERIQLEESRLQFDKIQSSIAPSDFSKFINQYPLSIEAPMAIKLYFQSSVDSLLLTKNIEAKWNFLDSQENKLRNISNKKNENLYSKLLYNISNDYLFELKNTNDLDQIQIIKKNINKRKAKLSGQE